MWNGRRAHLSSVPIAAITCGHPGNPINGLTQGSQFNLNDVVKFVCNPGYIAEGSARSQCLASGQWSDTLPTCRSESPFLPRCPPHHPVSVGSPGGQAMEFGPSVTSRVQGVLEAEKGPQMETVSPWIQLCTISSWVTRGNQQFHLASFI